MQCQTRLFESLNATTFYKKASKLCTVCNEQWDEMKLEIDGRCQKCLKQLNVTETICLDCAFLSEKFNLMDKLYCAYQYDGIVKEMIHQYKFMKDVAIAEILVEKIRLPHQKYDYVVPIPSSVYKDQERTFNPVRFVLDLKQVNYHCLLRMQSRPKQSKLSKPMRAQLANPFEIISMVDLKEKNILLVDDIYTTGLTAHHAAQLLFDRKIRKFDVFTFAR
ncbi:ComF family protein [Staphylococcus nepalensis]|uniref:ComF family protein n=1 Tax=Staphylococcus nepalensis TaxID=214473 RepID=UPI001A99778B|nr:ComF family protein [Staphylococcus nepalensis]MBO1222532.1 ComF family protein [Staphylococcus nepalensis]